MIEPHALGVDRKDFKGDKLGFAGYRIAQTMDAACETLGIILFLVRRGTKRLVNLAKQDPGRARHSS